MKNIKAVEVIKALPGLEIGDVLSREDSNSNFELNVEEITKSYSAKRHISLSQSLLNKDEFKAIEWFVQKPSYIARLEAENKEMASVLNKYESRIAEKITEYTKKENELKGKLNDIYLSGESMEWADEALTVYHNMIDLLKKIVA